jgi:thiol:disulfide interchange protein DsbD
MRRFRSAVRSLLASLLLLIGPSLAGLSLAQPVQSADDPSPHSEATLVSDAAPIAPGEPFTVALRLAMEDGWHSYWKNPGDSGQPTSIDWSLPDGFTAGPVQWPYPHPIEASTFTSYGYSGEVRLLTTVTPPEDLTPGTRVTLEAKARWLICADICLPAHSDVSLTVPVADAPSPTPAAAAIDAARSKLPRSVDGWSVQAARSAGSYTLALRPPEGHRPALDGAVFFPAEKPVLDHAAPQPVSRQSDAYLMALQQSAYASSPVDTLRGVLVAPAGTSWDPDGTTRALSVAVPVDSVLTGLAAAGGSGGGSLSLPWALLFAFAGGLLLNLMPCVFPVLSVKILGFVRQSDAEGRAIRTHGLLFAAGVLVSMWGLAGALLGLRAAGSQIGWGFQLQSPTFVALMTLLFVAIGLNLLGAFEVGTRLMNWGGQLQSETPSEGPTGSFLTGVLATVVATPCTAPFMGAALGLALTLSLTGSLLIFTALGAGMAAPYVGLSMSPGLLQRLPQPGPWMETLKQFFAFPMFATAIWLVWVFGQQTGNGGVALLLFGILLLGMGAWVLHRWSAPQLSRAATVATRGIVTAMLLGAVAAGVIGARATPLASTPETSETASASDATWQPYAASTVEALRDAGRPVFVDFTAAWCLTCQVNERTVLNTEPVQAAFAERDVALVKADWTNRDPAITKALKAHGRSGVPVYVLYPGDGSGPTLLPEVLTEDIVLDALDAVPASEPAS